MGDKNTYRPSDVFIGEPFQTCPSCGSNRFGRLWVQPRAVVRKCADCGYSARTELPEIQRKLIYLDQFAISNMMKALDRNNPASDKMRDQGWLSLFERLDRLAKLQLIVCPESPAHEIESSLHGSGFQQLQRLYELLARDVEFKSSSQIRGRQVYRHAVDWIRGDTENSLDLYDHDALRGRPHAWSEPFLIRVRYPIGEDETDRWRELREQGASQLEPIFRRWQGEQDLSFKDWYVEELRVWPRFVWDDFLMRTSRFMAAARGLRELDQEDMFPSTDSRELVHILSETFAKEGVPEENALERVRDFLHSETFERVPRIRISSLLWAGIAHQAAHGGRKTPPNRGMLSDIEVVSSVLPYCDAVLVDNEVRALLELGHVRERIGVDTRAYSKSSLESFIEYLNDIEASADPEHVVRATEVYGEPEPYLTIFDEASKDEDV